MSLKPSGTRTISSNPSKSKLKNGISDLLPELTPERKKILTVFCKTTGIRFKNHRLLNLSFTHSSIANECGLNADNERLEFLGDAVLGVVAATLLYQKLVEQPEGELSKIKSVVVSEDVLSGVARELQIDSLLLLGKGEQNSGGRTKKAILADALESVIGAIYLDSGFDAAFSFVSRFLGDEIVKVQEDRHHRDYKSLLQILTQRYFHVFPVYRVVKRSGPDHARIFWVEVTVNGRIFGPGTGKNVKSAEQEAARMAFEVLEPEEKP